MTQGTRNKIYIYVLENNLGHSEFNHNHKTWKSVHTLIPKNMNLNIVLPTQPTQSLFLLVSFSFIWDFIWEWKWGNGNKNVVLSVSFDFIRFAFMFSLFSIPSHPNLNFYFNYFFVLFLFAHFQIWTEASMRMENDYECDGLFVFEYVIYVFV